MPGPLPLPIMRTEARIPLEHRANSILFGRCVVKRSHGETHDRTVDTCGYSRREAQLVGASPPINTTSQPKGLAAVVIAAVPPEPVCSAGGRAA